MQYLSLFLLSIFLACESTAEDNKNPIIQPQPIPDIGYKIAKIYKHNPEVFTQGFYYIEPNTILESSGLYEKSFIQYYHLETEKVSAKKSVSPTLFAEGITLFKNRLYMLTWKEGKCLVWDKKFQLQKTFPLQTEGWGITNNDSFLIVSSGTDKLDFYNPDDFSLVKSLRVFMPNTLNAVYDLNELEYIDGYIYANIWGEDYIVKIDSKSGAVVGILNLHEILNTYLNRKETDPNAVLNGIAWDKQRKQMYVTGKYWPVIFALELL